MNRNTIIDKLKSGYQAVLIPADFGSYPSIFWVEDEDVFCFNKAMGLFKHPKSIEEIADFIDRESKYMSVVAFRGAER